MNNTDTKKFYTIKIKNKNSWSGFNTYQYISIDKTLTRDFESAKHFQSDPNKKIEKLVKQGFKAKDIQIEWVN